MCAGINIIHQTHPTHANDSLKSSSHRVVSVYVCVYLFMCEDVYSIGRGGAGNKVS